MGIQINGNTNNINAGIGSLSIEDINELDIVGVATASNFKTGVSNLHNVGLTLSGGQIDVGSNIKLGNAGVITATSFVGSGANLTGITQTTINNYASTRIVTATNNANELDAETNLTVNGSLVTFADSTLMVNKGTNPTISAKETAGNKEVQLRANTTGGLLRTVGSYPFVFGTNQAERLRITANGHLLLGTSTDYADNNSDDFQIYGTGHTGMSITSGSSNYGSIYFGDATSGDARNEGIVRYNHSNNSMELWTNNSEKLRINSNGDMGLGLTASYSGIFGGSQRTFQIGGTAAPCLRITSSTSNQADLVIHAGNSGRRADIANITANGSISMWTKPSSGSIAERIKISADGYVTKPNQPSFRAHDSNHAQTGFLTFDQIATNVGNHYSGSNGRFTAPVAGTYFFSFYGMLASSSGNARVEYYINGSVHSSGEHYGGVAYTNGTTYNMITCNTVLTLNANDYVNLNWNASYNSMHSYHNGFMGFLIG